MDLLRERAEAFNNLLSIKYNFVLGKRGVCTNLSLSFDKTHFHHLIGLQNLTDRPQLRKDRALIFNQILNNELTFNQICRSSLFHTIEKRFLSFVNIEKFLDSNDLVFKFNGRANPASKMKAEYILENTINDVTGYLCIDKTNEYGEYFCRSYFPKEEINYTAGHTIYTLLYKEKINIITHDKIVLCNKLLRQIK